MAFPIKSGRNFKVEYVERPAGYSMRSTEIYTEYYGIGYIISGDCKISTPGHTFFVHKGHISLINMNLYHHTVSISREPHARYGVKFTPAITERIAAHLGREKFKQIMSHVSYFLEPAIQAQVLRIYREMLVEYERYDEHSEFLLQCLLEQLIITILREGKITESAEYKHPVKDSVILNTLSHIDRHYADNPTIKELSALAGLSESHFMKRFRESVGSTYKTYLNQYKVKIAQGLLLHTSLSLQEISEELGFCNPNYFSSTFKQYTAISPSEYRHLHKKDN